MWEKNNSCWRVFVFKLCLFMLYGRPMKEASTNGNTQRNQKEQIAANQDQLTPQKRGKVKLGESDFFQYLAVSISFSRNNKNVFRNNRFQQMSAMCSYVDHGTRMTLSSMFCVLQASCGVRMVVQSFWTTRAILPSP